MDKTLKNHHVKEFGSRLKAAREASQYTQAKLAELSGRSVDAISKMERGETLPRFEALYDLCRALEISPSELMPDMNDRQVSKSRLKIENELIINMRALNDDNIRVLFDLSASLRRKPK